MPTDLSSAAPAELAARLRGLTDDDIDRAVLRSAGSWLAQAARTLPGTEGRAGGEVLALSELLWQLAAAASMAGQGHAEALLWLRALVADGIDEREPASRGEGGREWRKLYMRKYREKHRAAITPN